MSVTPDWIALDWGTSNLRAWAMKDGRAVANVSSSDGMGALARDGFEPALAALVDVWDVPAQTPVIACGMVGSRQGWVEAPYNVVPCAPLVQSTVRAPSDRFNVQVIAGLRQSTPSDVMRGEETQIAGFLALNPDWDGVICLPGTHTKWVQISAGEVISFQTYMSGELFALLSGQSVLRHSVNAEHWDQATFDFTIEDALSKPEKLAARLFAIRADDLLEGATAEVGRARLSGLLIGAELAAARPYWLGTNIAIIGADGTATPYARALQTQGASATIADAERMTLAGLTTAYRRWKDTL
ncbi:2-dehydro-3-deoxygalactonokinase [Sulfitobacter geojensis]|uniref:2-dehydro-3-deoxygalactonokinase n=1 Tax=Sulfitobacter geojensis TaxID=1342299 RepID=A0AAE2VWF3_9RHOB|nr:2-dehydro-3-deoxygalactonokinase [Sulfitobacter geojensis]MBM1688619.1 2-dehydro-3-deoxygalactonokinase [Sulfitobacter geojensis]MBM1692686.1 2-dehydro-3-deoxygalactonokinase [Sulfitobacter geojensis]MBM1704852.1 2-dehydro-3-deoxygalactonokinase [Sulfitobacter geojensis]MBM1708910.1 2-dehydro-3-deoxygalactonokinase [Sulfitobacter geojensis]MBM1712975.1 2-dehydro-3-deoxygalactonokinase [Sulfitobacter geojensis]